MDINIQYCKKCKKNYKLGTSIKILNYICNIKVHVYNVVI